MGCYGVYLSICVFVYICIFVFLYLSTCVFDTTVIIPIWQAQYGACMHWNRRHKSGCLSFGDVTQIGINSLEQ